MFILVIVVYAIIGFYEMFPMIKNKQKKELILYGITFGTAFILSMLLSLGVEIPSPADPIEAVINYVIGK
ncbi:hypothetical protein OXPF_07020 [Oxobacter pfennigii]|uniref:Uncharacterized protein n=1 Tax=Oxobacter pfennigii TaxID=36849 RepID=A0A0P8WA33_9CLOT|nr:hypothetical protein [Oxobacter pfennigii]KPU45469.1 hypothetical protein OXPF_07020 [Oxobacter pfennigii]